MAFTHGRGGGRVLFTLAVGVGAGVDCVFAQSIVRIEPPAGSSFLQTFSMSRDGRYVGGVFTDSFFRPVPMRWSRVSAAEGFELPAWARFGGVIYAVSNSGAGAGETITGGNPWDRPASAWRENRSLAFAFGSLFSFQTISDDGRVIAGTAPYVFVDGNPITFGGGAYPQCFDMSADGSFVVGGVSTGQTTASAFTWSRAGEVYMPIGGPGGWQYNRALAVSGDGNVVAGISANDQVGRSLWLWTQAGGFVELPIAPDARFRWDGYQRPDLNGDGSVLVCNFLGSDARAMIWRRGEGFSRLDAFLADAGVDLSGWTGLLVQNVSDDGLVFSGTGEYQGVTSSWHAVIPGPWSALALVVLAVRRRRG
jgi:hypothetical protein